MAGEKMPGRRYLPGLALAVLLCMLAAVGGWALKMNNTSPSGQELDLYVICAA